MCGWLDEQPTFLVAAVTIHYGRSKLSRVPHTSPSAKNRALGEANLPRVLHSGKTGTRKRKVTFDGNIRRSRLQKKIEKKLFPECLDLGLGEGDLFPESRLPTLGEGTSSSSALSLALGE
jgi:hypothetical protein